MWGRKVIQGLMSWNGSLLVKGDDKALVRQGLDVTLIQGFLGLTNVSGNPWRPQVLSHSSKNP